MTNRINKISCSIALLLLLGISASFGFGIILNALNFEPSEIQSTAQLRYLENILNKSEIRLHSVVETSDINRMIPIFFSSQDTDKISLPSHNSTEHSISTLQEDHRTIVKDRFSPVGSMKMDNDTEYIILRDMFTAGFLILDVLKSGNALVLITENESLYLVENDTWYFIQ
ncbi:hypothetical protein [Spirochaeta dissipatitropha]